jgi:hypothetical protein
MGRDERRLQTRRNAHAQINGFMTGLGENTEREMELTCSRTFPGSHGRAAN